MRKKRVIIGISVAAVVAVIAAVLAAVFGVRAARKNSEPEHVHSFDYNNITWIWDDCDAAQASVFCICGEEMSYNAAITQTPIAPATCEGTGETLSTAKITENGAEYVNEKIFELPPLGHEYDYSELVWSWEEEPVVAKASAPCLRDNTHVIWLTPDTDEEILLKPDCESEGSVRYTAKVTANGIEYTDAVLRKIPALGHDYASKFSWESNYAAAMLQLNCKRSCGNTYSELVEAVFSHADPDCEKNGADTYTVRTTYEGKEYSETFVRSIPASGHDYDYSTLEWLWEERTAKAIVQCKQNKNHILQGETEIEEEILTAPSCLEAGEGRYTAIFRRDGNTFTDTQVLPVPALGHDYDYSSAIWEWEGTQAANATVRCTRDPAHTQTLSARITANVTEAPSCTQTGVAEYTATVTDAEGKAYTNTIRTEAPAGGHSYGKAEFWDNDVHELVCKDCGHRDFAVHENGDNEICTLCGVSTWLYYTYSDADGAFVTASAYSDEFPSTCFKTAVIVPGRYCGSGNVASVKGLYFTDCNRLESVELSEGIETISKNAFEQCTALKKIVLPEGITRIEQRAFAECFSLAQIKLPSTLTYIGDEAFSGSSLTELKLPSALTHIGSLAFYSCYNVEFDLPSALTYIGDRAFERCWAIKEATVPGSVTELGFGVFSECSGLARVTVLSGVNTIGREAFSGCSSLVEIQLPDGLRSIGQEAFRGCVSLCEIQLPDGLESIGDQVFWYCTSLTEIVIPRSVEKIGSNAFRLSGAVSIYCEAATKPSGWSNDWNSSGCPVYWAYEGE